MQLDAATQPPAPAVRRAWSQAGPEVSDMDSHDRPAGVRYAANGFEPIRMSGRVGEVICAIVGHHEDRGIRAGQPALKEHPRRHRMIDIVVAGRQVVERVV